MCHHIIGVKNEHVSNGQWTFHGATCHHHSGKNFNDWDLIQWVFNFENIKNLSSDTCPQASCLIFKHVSYFD